MVDDINKRQVDDDVRVAGVRLLIVALDPQPDPRLLIVALDPRLVHRSLPPENVLSCPSGILTASFSGPARAKLQEIRKPSLSTLMNVVLCFGGFLKTLI